MLTRPLYWTAEAEDFRDLESSIARPGSATINSEDCVRRQPPSNGYRHTFRVPRANQRTPIEKAN